MGRSWSGEQKRAQGSVMRKYWAEHPHPRKGRKATDETKKKLIESQQRSNWTKLGTCKRCGGPLFTETSVKRGYGMNCLKHQIEEGYTEFDPYTGTVTELVEPDA